MRDSHLIKRREDEHCTVISDQRYLPILITYVVGESTQDAVNFFFDTRNEVLQQAVADKKSIVVVSDMSRSGMPPATIRKLIGERTKGDPNIPSILGYVNVVSNALIRGMVTAVQWIVGDGLRPIKTVTSVDEAIKAAIPMFHSAGIDIDFDSLRNYTPPEGVNKD